MEKVRAGRKAARGDAKDQLSSYAHPKQDVWLAKTTAARYMGTESWYLERYVPLFGMRHTVNDRGKLDAVHLDDVVKARAILLEAMDDPAKLADIQAKYEAMVAQRHAARKSLKLDQFVPAGTPSVRNRMV